VTGATGFTGANLTKKLVEMDLDVVAIARPSSDLQQFEDFSITWFRGDVADEELINKAMEGVSYVFHMVTPFREAKAPDEQYYNVHVLSTQLLAKAALQQPSFKRFIHVSTIGIHGHIANPPANETYRVEPGDIYQQTKWEGEVWIREFSQSTGLPTVVVRPAGIYGPGDKRFLKVFKWAYQGLIPVIGDGSNLLHFIHVEDLTDFFIVAAIHEKAIGEIFICGSEHAMTFKNMVNLISNYYGSNARFLKLPKQLLFLIGDILEGICRPFGVEPPIYRRRLAFYTKDRSFDTSKMRNLLSFSTKYSDEEGLTELAQWYVDNNWLSSNGAS
jgi:nucleoside-diphosphate-sugar epimerase